MFILKVRKIELFIWASVLLRKIEKELSQMFASFYNFCDILSSNLKIFHFKGQYKVY